MSTEQAVHGQTERTPSELGKNEELAVRVKAGDTAAAAQLWEQNTGLLTLISGRLYYAFRDRATSAGVTWDDVQQIGYMAILAAAKGFDPETGAKCSAYLPYHVRKEFYQLIGMRTERSRKEPLCHAGSIDAPLVADDADSGTLSEVIPDPEAAALLENTEAQIWNTQLHETLEKCLDSIGQTEADVIRRRYFKGEPITDIAATYMRSPARIQQISENALRQLRRPQISRHLRDYHSEIVSRAYRYTGFSAWKTGGSSPERWAEWAEEKEAQRHDRIRAEVRAWAESLVDSADTEKQ